ncbi:MAG: alpha/beta family hydrolase [Bryobacteraceae bacterium]|nr:alpha/beta family hydrolase [Bryobacteraceae bacterium]
MARRIESLFVNGPVGRLEALLEEPEDRDPVFAALVCHPHPRHGGTMHNKVVYRIARGLRKSGAVVLRFNYRGVNLSEGEYDHGNGEVEDARAALSLLLARYPQLPYTLAGFSFGSRIALKLGCELPHASRVIAVGFPTAYKDRAYLERCTTVPRIFVQSTHDEHGPLAELEPLVASLPEPKRLITVPAKDHFFAGALDAFEAAIVALG